MIQRMAETPSKTSSKTPNASTDSVQTGDGATQTKRQAPSAARVREPVRASLAGTEHDGRLVDLVTGNAAEDLAVEDGVIVPVPGDPATEPVATAAQSHVAGRVGPRTVPEDATSVQSPGVDGIDEVRPGEVLADTVEGVGHVPVAEPLDDPVGENLARISRDQEDGVALDGQGRRLPGQPGVQTREARISR